jgi:hypothetical protein
MWRTRLRRREEHTITSEALRLFFRMSLSAPHYEKNLNEFFMVIDLSSVDLWLLGKKPYKRVKKSPSKISQK